LLQNKERKVQTTGDR